MWKLYNHDVSWITFKPAVLDDIVNICGVFYNWYMSCMELKQCMEVKVAVPV